MFHFLWMPHLLLSLFLMFSSLCIISVSSKQHLFSVLWFLSLILEAFFRCLTPLVPCSYARVGRKKLIGSTECVIEIVDMAGLFCWGTTNIRTFIFFFLCWFKFTRKDGLTFFLEVTGQAFWKSSERRELGVGYRVSIFSIQTFICPLFLYGTPGFSCAWNLLSRHLPFYSLQSINPQSSAEVGKGN